jgi:hypothetical protein
VLKSLCNAAAAPLVPLKLGWNLAASMPLTLRHEPVRLGAVRKNVMRKWILPREPAVAGQSPAQESELQQAYHRGRRDERARRRRSPLAMLVVSLTALAGAGMLAVSAWQGSFTQGGAMVDHQITTAADQAEPHIQAAAQDARSALREAGQEAKTKAQDLVGG